MDPILISIAAAAAGKASEAVVQGGATAVRKAAELVRRHRSGRSELERAERGEIDIDDFASTLDRWCAEDADFRQRLGEAVGRPIHVAISHSRFHNEFHGEVKNVVQAETITGLRLD